MATLGSNKLQTRKTMWSANMTDQNQLGQALIAKPTVFAPVMDQIFSAKNLYSGNPLTSMLKTMKMGEKTITGTEWEWTLKGANEKPLVVLEDVEASSTPGKGKTEFSIKLDENWYLPGDVIAPGNKSYQCRIQSQAKRHGNGWIYSVRLANEDINAFLPKAYLSGGTKWAKIFSSYGEAAEQAGSTQFSFPIAFKNSLGKLRKQYKVTDYASQEVLEVAMRDSKGGVHSAWMKYAEVEYWMQWYKECERAIWYSRKSDSILDSTGRPARQFPGIQEQLEGSHVHRYTHLTAKLIEDYLMTIFYGRIAPGSSGRNVVGYTGEYGMVQFGRAIEDWAASKGFVLNVESFTGGMSSDYTSVGKTAGFQYVKYSMKNGISITMAHNPLYDDPTINWEIDPITGYPLESQRITFLDFAGEGGENVQLVNKKDSEYFKYIAGTASPFMTNNSFAAHSGDYYEMVVGKSFGVHVNDVSRCGELILTRN